MFVIIFRVAKLAVTQEGNSSVFKKREISVPTPGKGEMSLYVMPTCLQNNLQSF